MKYSNVIEGKFIDRPNRFIAHVEIDGKKETVHVCNTGRCKELLVKNATVFLSVSDNPSRKTNYDLVGVIKETPMGSIMINMDSYAPNKAVGEWLNNGGLSKDITQVRSEVKYGNSRFDFSFKRADKNCFLEVKGVTLEENGIVSFPDAPTLRGLKHIDELIECMKEGYESYICFVIQMSGMKYFQPNDKIHKEFGDALRRAAASGVHIIAIECNVTKDSMIINEKSLEVVL